MPDLTQAKVARIPNCQLCEAKGKAVRAYADARIPSRGYWAYICYDDFVSLGCSLGTGKGQTLILDAPDPDPEPEDFDPDPIGAPDGLDLPREQRAAAIRPRDPRSLL